MIERSTGKSNLSREARKASSEVRFRDRKLAEGVAVDPGDTRNIDDIFGLRREGGKTLREPTPDALTAIPGNSDLEERRELDYLTISVADVSAAISKNSARDEKAMKGNGSGALFPPEVLDDLTLKIGQPRATVSITVPLEYRYHLDYDDPDGRYRREVISRRPIVQSTRVQLGQEERLTYGDVHAILQNPDHKMFHFFQRVARIAADLRRQRRPETLLGNPDFPWPSMIVEEVMGAANSSILSQFAENDTPAIFMARRDGLSFYTPFYEEGNTLNATSPLRRPDALVNQRILTTTYRGKRSPYSRKKLNDICRSLNEQTHSEDELRQIYKGDRMGHSERKRMPESKRKALAEQVKAEIVSRVVFEATGAKGTSRRQEGLSEKEAIKRRLKEAGPEQRMVYRRRKNVAPFGATVADEKRRRRKPDEEVGMTQQKEKGSGRSILNIRHLNTIPEGTIVTVDKLIELGLIPEEAREKGVRIHATGGTMKRAIEIVKISMTKRAMEKVREAKGRLIDIPHTPQQLGQTYPVRNDHGHDIGKVKRIPNPRIA